MARAAIRRHHRSVPVNTAGVTAEQRRRRPAASDRVTGLSRRCARPAGLRDRDGPPRRRLHPEIPGAENTLARLPARGRARLPATSRPTCTPPATACCWPSTTTSLDRVTDQRGLPGGAHARSRSRLARIGASTRCPRWPSCSRSFPDCRFNIDLKSAGRRGPLVELLDLTAATTGSASGPSRSRRIRAFRRASAGRVATSAAPPEVAAFRFRVPAPPGRPRLGQRRCRCPSSVGR